MFDNYVLESLSFAYISDADRPISFYPQSDDEVEQFFDEISYDRGMTRVHIKIIKSCWLKFIMKWSKNYRINVNCVIQQLLQS